MTAPAEEILEDLLGELRNLGGPLLEQFLMHGCPGGECPRCIKNHVLALAARAHTRLAKVRLGVVAA